MTNCKHCGKPIDEDSYFCKYCGVPVYNPQKIRYYLAIFVIQPQIDLTSFYDSLNKNGIDFTIIDLRASQNDNYTVATTYLEKCWEYFEEDADFNRAVLFDNEGIFVGSFVLNTEEQRFYAGHFLSYAPFQILPFELFGESQNIIKQYLLERNKKRVLFFRITGTDDENEYNQKVKPIIDLLKKNNIDNYSVNYYSREKREILEYDCEYGIYRQEEINAGAIYLLDKKSNSYFGWNINGFSEPFCLTELLGILKNPNYHIVPYSKIHEYKEEPITNFFDKFLLFVNIKTDRAAKITEQPVEESNLEIWPRLSSISWILSDCEGNIKYEIKKEVKLEDSYGSTLKNDSDLSIEDTLELFYDFYGSNMIIVGHNIDLIKKILIAECFRLKQEYCFDENEYFWFERLANMLRHNNSICTMTSAIDYYIEKKPYHHDKCFSLTDLYNLLFDDKKNIEIDQAVVIYNCFQKLLEKGIICNPYSDIISKRQKGNFE
jgi:hypothetical protein